MLKIKRLFAIVLMIICASSLFAQGKPYTGPEDGAGDPNLEREGKMTGNRAMIAIKNNTELGGWPRTDTSRWPNTADGTKMNDGIGLLLGARVYLTQDTIPVEDMDEVAALAAQGLIDTLYYCETNYREEMDFDPTGTIEWGLHAAPGYSNINAETPAFSNDPDSWPPIGWPSVGLNTKWPGEWDGYFGRGVTRADLEAYMVANDAQDQEYLGSDDRVKYYPRPGVHIGDMYPSVTIQRGLPWGGLGMRVELRSFQWNNPHAQDAVFFQYNIANISDYDLPEMSFGYWMDNNIGGDGAGEDAYYRASPYNLAYAWDRDGVGSGGAVAGVQGFAYLESPGIADDNVDNDNDGLVDEQRDNDAGQFIGPYDGITNLPNFLSFYNLTEADLKDHWSGDEDQDWIDGIDENGDGIYDAEEYAGDDVGTDGVGPGDLNYTAPDEDGTECNHKPDFTEGIGSEPNFAEVDVSESDMLGLTTFQLYVVPQHVAPYERWFRNDESMWEATTADTFSEESQNISNLGELFATGVFPLLQGKTERISMALLYSYEEHTTLIAPGHSAPAMFTLKETVQIIYEKDYRFAQPPLMPTLTAIPGDGQVVLTWDNRSDKLTKESLLDGENDFEGYKIYRATDKFFADPVVITDGYGTATFSKPIFQCDLIDGKSGFTDFGLMNGAAFYLGEDTGITHTFVDESVENGRTYYYAIVAYDYGISPDRIKSTSSDEQEYGISPTENTITIDKDESENVTQIGANVAIVTPGVQPAGYDVAAEFDVDDSGLMVGSGSIVPELAVPALVKDGHTYKVKFETYTLPKASNADQEDVLNNYEDRGLIYTTAGVEVFDVTEGGVSVFSDRVTHDTNGNLTTENYSSILELDTRDSRTFYHLPLTAATTDIFDGLRLSVQMDSMLAAYAPMKSGWLGDATSAMKVVVPTTDIPYTPWDYYIVFTEDTRTFELATSGIRDAKGSLLARGTLISDLAYNFKVENRSFPVDSETGEYEQLVAIAHDLNGNGAFDILEDEIIVGNKNPEQMRLATTAFVINFQDLADESELPKAGDTYKVSYMRPFFSTDSLLFTVNLSEGVDENKIKSDMDAIKVVPNPYVATNMMEPAVANYLLNQDRRITFTHIPENCTIKIFTVSGVLVDEIHAPEDGLVAYEDPDGNELGQYNTGAIHWDLLSKEGLEIAAGMYLYHVKDEKTGNEKIGKFAVIK